ncbi:cytochrome oxidase c subunit VIb-domain-containing protein [Microdochium trichocladiopsis]|uniref:Cytochrome oxidase c subunit VIb-domain-containing protein n=1 Tax=Microdochium trichocladiopsis TaxID=1682393 RepID=A0A9P8Y283_9PEZI|nr:cytochrome oxidase c subunit VIb-domain-containing protein [Microdochium trichocladiopsis]KAH7029099.1 cytochrome oxidase c subunit VIb-domain-containing protein [Microdochium trichocladiopsis]
MGVLNYFTASADDKRKEEVRSGAVAPDRSERKRCWEARDNYFACLDKHDIIDSVNGDGKKLADKNCAAENKVFEQDCATAWVAYFKKFRVAEYQKKKTLERLQKEGANNMAADSAAKR